VPPAKKPPAKKPAGRKPAAKKPPSRDAIAERAYFLSRDDPGGDPESHWLQAERELSGTAAKKPRKRATT
jgi:hypothetical protein